MLRAIAALLVCQLAGEVIARALGLPVPGPVIGLVILLGALATAAARGRVTPETVERTELGRLATALLASIGILFVPAGVGVVQQLDRLAGHGPALLASLVGSTILALLATVAVFRAVKRLEAGRDG
jgi:putative effector of murein hydrolase LrgA (UPF0299 family)